jgi:hypothetical protein
MFVIEPIMFIQTCNVKRLPVGRTSEVIHNSSQAIGYLTFVISENLHFFRISPELMAENGIRQCLLRLQGPRNPVLRSSQA